MTPWKGNDAPFDHCLMPRHSAQETLVHEAGHVLGIRGSRDARIPNDDHHPLLTDSVMSYGANLRYSCSPTPFDVMAIYAIYQTKLTRP